MRSEEGSVGPTEQDEFILIRVLNNNSVLAQVGGERRVLLGRGLGFGKHLGDIVDPSAVEEMFVPQGDVVMGRLSSLVSEIPLEVFLLTRKIVDLAESTRGTRASQALLISLADHLHFAMERARDGVEIDFPLRWEIEQLYPVETALGRESVQLATRESGLPINPAESTALAMHFVNAEFASSDISATVTMTRSLNVLVDMVKEELGLDPQRNGAAIARFVTHLRYLFVRINQGALLTDLQPALTQMEMPADVADLAARVRAQIESTGGTLTDAEYSYLRLHVWRLSSIKR